MGSGGRPGYHRATVVGGGVIGISWTALFLAHGLEVTVCDPLPDVAERVHAGLREIAPTLAQLGLPVDDLTDSTDALGFDPEVASAVAGTDVVQENGPERSEVKQQLWSTIEAGAPTNALLASSSSGIPASVMSQAMRQPGRLIIGPRVCMSTAAYSAAIPASSAIFGSAPLSRSIAARSKWALMMAKTSAVVPSGSARFRSAPFSASVRAAAMEF